MFKSSAWRFRTYFSAGYSIDSSTFFRNDVLALFYHLTANGADIEAVSSVKQTALHLAASGNNDVLLKRLIEFCANINAVDIDGCTALHYAAFNERDDMVKLLIDSGIDVYKSKQSK